MSTTSTRPRSRSAFLSADRPDLTRLTIAELEALDTYTDAELELLPADYVYVTDEEVIAELLRRDALEVAR